MTTASVRPLPWPAWRLAASMGITLLCASAQPAAAQATPVAAPGAAPVLDVAFDDAMHDYERCHWPQAFEALRQLADQGHASAARVVLQMHHHGQRLYGLPMVLTPQQLQHLRQQRI